MALETSGSSTQYVEVSAAASINTLATGTYMSWVFIDSFGAALRSFASKGGDAGWKVLHETTGELSLRMKFATQQMQLTTTGALSTGVWQFIAVSWNGATPTGNCYLGDLTTLAVEDTTETQAGIGAQANDDALDLWLMGYAAGDDLSPDGRTATALLFNSVLTLAQIQSLQFHPRVLSSSVGYWDLHNAAVNQPDYSGNGNAGVPTNSPTSANHVPLRAPWGFDVPVLYVVAAVAGGPSANSRSLMGTGI